MAEARGRTSCHGGRRAQPPRRGQLHRNGRGDQRDGGAQLRRHARPELSQCDEAGLNLLKLLFGPLRAVVLNWDEVAREVLERAQREAATDRDASRRQVIEECLGDAPADWCAARPEAPPRLVVTVDLRLGDLRARLFSTTNSS
jgi:hypothetical protein